MNKELRLNDMELEQVTGGRVRRLRKRIEEIAEELEKKKKSLNHQKVDGYPATGTVLLADATDRTIIKNGL